MPCSRQELTGKPSRQGPHGKRPAGAQGTRREHVNRKVNASPAATSLAMTTKPRRRSAITALFAAAIVLLLALPAFASADPLGSSTFYSGLRSTAGVTTSTLGSDGNVWFVDHAFPFAPFSPDPAIGRITPSGEIEE